MSTSEHLSDAADNARQAREGKVAAAALLRNYIRSGGRGGTPRAAEAIAARITRIDGTPLSIPAEPVRRSTSTNHANHITHATTPLDGDN